MVPSRLEGNLWAWSQSGLKYCIGCSKLHDQKERKERSITSRVKGDYAGEILVADERNWGIWWHGWWHLRMSLGVFHLLVVPTASMGVLLATVLIST